MAYPQFTFQPGFSLINIRSSSSSREDDEIDAGSQSSCFTIGKVLRPLCETDSSKECTSVTVYLQVISGKKSFERYSLEVPDVLELCVGGTHRYTTLLVTMTQANAGCLADIFMGKVNVPLHVLADGSFFIDTDGESFKLIIEYLRDGRLPDMDVDSTKGTSMCEELLLKSFRTARKYRLQEYLHGHDQYVPIQRFKQLEANKDIVEFYAKQILWALNITNLEQNGKFAILLKSTNSTVISAGCYEHVCQFAPVDTVVHLTRDFSLRIFSLLCQRLRYLSYNVAATQASCLFRCSTHKEGDADRKASTIRRHLLTWFCPTILLD